MVGTPYTRFTKFAYCKRVEQIINQLKEKSDLAENMKNTDMLYWVGTMNSIKVQAEEIVFSELIYV